VMHDFHVILTCEFHVIDVFVFPDRPSPPSNVQFTSCFGKTTQVSWRQSNSNNDPIQEYNIEYRTLFDLPGVNNTPCKMHYILC